MQQDRLTVSKAREGAEDFLTAQAHRLLRRPCPSWIACTEPLPLSPLRIRRSVLFSRDTVEEVQSSEKRRAFLRRLGEERSIAPSETRCRRGVESGRRDTSDSGLRSPTVASLMAALRQGVRNTAAAAIQADTAASEAGDEAGPVVAVNAGGLTIDRR